MNKRTFHRRAFLRGAGGVAIGLPFLESLAPRHAHAAAPKRFAVFFQCNGVNMERFWPGATGALTPDSLKGTSLEPIAHHASKLLIPRGIAMAPKGWGADAVPGCDHQKGMGSKLTCTALSSQGGYPTGPSIDHVIAKSINPGNKDPFNLGVGSGDPSGPLSRAFYTGSGQPAQLRNNPWKAYQEFVGRGAAPGSMPVVDFIAKRRQSVLDVVKEDLKALQGNATLGKADKTRLDLHFTSIRALESTMMTGGGDPGMALACNLAPDRAREIETGAGGSYEKVAPLMMEVAALALACDYNRVVTVQMATGSGGPIYRWCGDKLNQQYNHHKLSHGSATDAGSGDLPANEWKTSLFNIDTWHMKMLAIWLDKLAAYEEPGGSVLTNTALLYINELSDGQSHAYKDLPLLVFGGAGGALKVGQYVKVTNNTGSDNDYQTNRLFTTLANAVGYKNDKGAPMTNFGKASTANSGEIAGMKA